MGVRTTAARTIGGAIAAIRLPADMALRNLGPGAVTDALQGAVNRADANARRIAATILGDDTLLADLDHRRKEPLGEGERSSRREGDARKKARKAGRRPQPNAKPRRKEARAARRGDSARRGAAPTGKRASGKAGPGSRGKVRSARPGEAVSGFPEPSGKDPGDISKDREPHHALSNPVRDPDPTEWPDPYETREDPRDPPDPDAKPFGKEPRAPTGSFSTSEPHPAEDPEAGDRHDVRERDRLDD
jgi:hypothetical protein